MPISKQKLSDVGDDIFGYILSFTEVQERLNLMCVCPWFNKIALSSFENDTNIRIEAEITDIKTDETNSITNLVWSYYAIFRTFEDFQKSNMRYIELTNETIKQTVSKKIFRVFISSYGTQLYPNETLDAANETIFCKYPNIISNVKAIGFRCDSINFQTWLQILANFKQNNPKYLKNCKEIYILQSRNAYFCKFEFCVTF